MKFGDGTMRGRVCDSGAKRRLRQNVNCEKHHVTNLRSGPSRIASAAELKTHPAQSTKSELAVFGRPRSHFIQHLDKTCKPPLGSFHVYEVGDLIVRHRKNAFGILSSFLVEFAVVAFHNVILSLLLWRQHDLIGTPFARSHSLINVYEFSKELNFHLFTL